MMLEIIIGVAALFLCTTITVLVYHLVTVNKLIKTNNGLYGRLRYTEDLLETVYEEQSRTLAAYKELSARVERAKVALWGSNKEGKELRTAISSILF